MRKSFCVFFILLMFCVVVSGGCGGGGSDSSSSDNPDSEEITNEEPGRQENNQTPNAPNNTTPESDDPASSDVNPSPSPMSQDLPSNRRFWPDVEGTWKVDSVTRTSTYPLSSRYKDYDAWNLDTDVITEVKKYEVVPTTIELSVEYWDFYIPMFDKEVGEVIVFDGDSVKLDWKYDGRRNSWLLIYGRLIDFSEYPLLVPRDPIDYESQEVQYITDLFSLEQIVYDDFIAENNTYQHEWINNTTEVGKSSIRSVVAVSFPDRDTIIYSTLEEIKINTVLTPVTGKTSDGSNKVEVVFKRLN